VRTKCAEKTCVGLWGYYWGPREQPGVGRPGLGGGAGGLSQYHKEKKR
jgi:hypothetical protein